MVNKYGLKNLGAVPTMEKAEQEGAKLEENEEETNSSQNWKACNNLTNNYILSQWV